MSYGEAYKYGKSKRKEQTAVIERMTKAKSYGNMPLRYNNDKRKKPLFSRGSRVCRHSFNSFSKLKHGEKNIEKRRLFH
ncbi:hypothetical protein D3Z38_12685 [Clostridiales bacterium]|nr:hypothetical protein [Clostridiales bacterium]